jgi:hypothetical protein
MPTAAKALRSVAREHHVLLANRYDIGADAAQKPVELHIAGVTKTRKHHK